MKMQIVKAQASGLLAHNTDWHVIKATEMAEYNVPENITTFRYADSTRGATNQLYSSDTAELTESLKLDACNNVGGIGWLVALHHQTEMEQFSAILPI